MCRVFCFSQRRRAAKNCFLRTDCLAPIAVESPQRSEDLERIAGTAPNEKS